MEDGKRRGKEGVVEKAQGRERALWGEPLGEV